MQDVTPTSVLHLYIKTDHKTRDVRKNVKKTWRHDARTCLLSFKMFDTIVEFELSIQQVLILTTYLKIKFANFMYLKILETYLY